jgi:hypothetical protein
MRLVGRPKPLRARAKGAFFMAKEIRKTIRFSDDEYEKIEMIMSEHNLTFAEFARGAILRKKIKTNLSKDMIFQVNKVGNNLNQIAKKVNQDSDRKNLLLKLIEIQNELKKISDVY